MCSYLHMITATPQFQSLPNSHVECMLQVAEKEKDCPLVSAFGVNKGFTAK